jgi:hypothetical protein
MDPLAAEMTVLLRTLESEVRLYPGRVLTARVIDGSDPARARLSLAGKLLEAKLPEALRDGEEVRLTVREVSADRVTLSLSASQEGLAAGAQAPLQSGGLAVQQDSSESKRDGDGAQGSVSLRYDAPSLGPLDMRLELRGGSLLALISVRAGASHELARTGASALREALSASSGLPVELVIRARHDPIELYA